MTDSQKEKTMNNWIDVKEFYPVKDTLVLLATTKPYDSVTAGSYIDPEMRGVDVFGNDYFWSLGDETSGTWQGGLTEKEVTHWMPLPKPPEVSDE